MKHSDLLKIEIVKLELLENAGAVALLPLGAWSRKEWEACLCRWRHNQRDFSRINMGAFFPPESPCYDAIAIWQETLGKTTNEAEKRAHYTRRGNDENKLTAT